MNWYKKIILAFVFSFMGMAVFAQMYDAPASQHEGLMQVDGKIYVVVAVVLVILIGLFIYLFSLDKKISKLEKGEQ